MTTKTLLGAVREVALTTGDYGAARCFKDAAPENPTFPYLVLHTVSGPTPILMGDGRTIGRETSIQVSLWEKLRDEDETIRARLIAALDSATLTPGGGRVYGSRVHDTQRLSEPANEVVQTAVTLVARHTPDVGV
jgi:hypothetical protein